ncbi:restriction endonuclease subunit S [Gelidibacter sp.]|uniref:restriction endonuclease subunit S n=1 Tax=Gelidibacter sp. TaxID=2018083 RepID=UPI002C73D739|nr:restriction endonuclease subunit S [Gelidibacter sp.]HUH26736.1 restriction endonuclease subunit S [Gelidibacter sp.]
MNSISRVKLGDLIEFQRGYDLPKSQFIKGEYPVQASNGVLGYHNEFKVKGPGITIGRSGTVGLPHLVKLNFFPHNTTLFVKDFKGNDIEYIFYLLKNLKLGDKKSGSSVPTMNRNHLHPIKIIAYKNLPTQKSIAKVLSDLDAKIELNNKINRELEAMAKTLYDYWFVQFDFPDANGKPYKSSGGKMVYNAELKREIPEGWAVKKLSQIANITMGQSPSGSSYNDDGIGEIFFQGSTDFGWRYPTIRQYTTEPSRMAKSGDILLSVRAPVGTLNIADNDCCIGRGLTALNSKSGYDSYLYYVMEYFKQIFDHRNNAGTTFGSITKDDLHSLKLVYPKDDLLKKYNQTVSKFNQMILINHKQNQHLTTLRDWLLPMLMNGQVTVRQAHGNAVQEAEERLNMAAEPSVKYGS